MAILILNRFPAHLVHFREWFSDLNEELFMFTTERLVNDFHDYEIVRGFSDYTQNELVEVEAMQLFEQRPFRAVIALDESDILRAARLRKNLQLEGQHPESAEAFRDKFVMKTYAQQNGIPCPTFAKIGSVFDLHEFVEENGLPLVLKPRDGMGAVNVRVIRSEGQLEEVYRKGVPDNFMVEAFVNGEMYEIDGLIVDHKVHFCSVGRYHNSLLSYKENGGVFTTLLSPQEDIYKRMRSFVENTLNAFPTPRYSSFHCEVFLTTQDEILLCEIASRSPGARITECIRQSYDVELDEVWSKLSCGIKVPLPLPQEMVVSTGSYLMPKQSGRLKSMIENFPFSWVTEYQPRVQVGYEQKDDIASCIDIIGSVVIQAKDERELMDRYQELLAYIDEHVDWEVLL